MTIAAVIVAAGKGVRLGGLVPKQYQRLGTEMVLTRTMRVFRESGRIGPIAVAIHPDAEDLFEQAIAGLADSTGIFPVHGGAERSESVYLALETLAAHQPDRVLIHDGARPFLSPDALARICDAEGGAILAEPVVDALWHAGEDDADVKTADTPVPRTGLWRAQTPQAFPFDLILAAHRDEATRTGPPALDDAEVYRRAGHPVALIPGEPDNFKITTSADMNRAERAIGGEKSMETRIGQGFDVHRFTEGDAVWLCGVKIPHSHRLVGHSDADVGLHALADAIYGALAEGDIGTHFPPSDPQWKGAESHIFLSHAAGLVAERGGRIVNTDLTLLCEAPKILPHAATMRKRLSEIIGIDAARISIKATTLERMGFIGREEGMGCMAIAAVEVPK